MKPALALALTVFTVWVFWDEMFPADTIWPYVWTGVFGLAAVGYTPAFRLVKRDERNAREKER